MRRCGPDEQQDQEQAEQCPGAQHGGGQDHKLVDMDDAAVIDHIDELVKEEERLLHSHEQAGLSEQEHARLEEIRVQLDRFWDLLSQRRSREQYELDPDDASIRDEGTVEGYEG